jgi:large conductance mechanosensitive channel
MYITTIYFFYTQRIQEYNRRIMLQGFKQFILKGNVVDLAVGIVIGVSFGNVVTALVKDLMTPFIGAFGGLPDFSSLSFTVNHSKFLIGDFLNVAISFVINAAVMYFFVILPINKLINVTKKQKPVDPTTKKCPECLSIIPLEAKRCAFCTTVLKK